MAHTFDASSRITPSTSNPVTGNYTCGADATVLVLSLAYHESAARNGGSPTYNGIEFTQVGTGAYSAANCIWAEIWYLLNPPRGASYEISIPNANGRSLEACISSYIAQSGYGSMLDAANVRAWYDNNPYCSITTNVNGDVIVACGSFDNQNFAPTGRSDNLLYETDNGTWGAGHQYCLQATAGSKTMSWTQSNNDYDVVILAAFKEVADALRVSKANALEVLSPPTGISGAKAQAEAVLRPPQGISVAKGHILVVLGPAPIDVSGFTVEVIEGDTPPPVQVAGVTVEVIFGGQPPTQTSQFVLEVIQGPDFRSAEAGAVLIDGITEAIFEEGGLPLEKHYAEAGDVVLDGITESRRSASTYIFREAGDVVVDGITEADRSFHYYDEEGAVVVDGITDTLSAVSNTSGVSQVVAEFLAQSSPAGSVSQVAAEFLIQGEAVGGVSQVGAEFLIRGNAPAYVPQIAAEFLVRNQHPKADFMPLLTRLLGARTEAQARLAAR